MNNRTRTGYPRPIRSHLEPADAAPIAAAEAREFFYALQVYGM